MTLSSRFLYCNTSYAPAGILLVLAGTAVVAVANVLWPMPELKPGLQAAQWSSWTGISRNWWQHSPLQATPGTVSATAMGVGLTLLSMFLLAARLVSEELLLTKSTLHPLQVSGCDAVAAKVLPNQLARLQACSLR